MSLDKDSVLKIINSYYPNNPDNELAALDILIYAHKVQRQEYVEMLKEIKNDG